MNCHGCKWLDRYQRDGNGYCCMVVRSKTQKARARFPDMERCELYEKGDWRRRYGRDYPDSGDSDRHRNIKHNQCDTRRKSGGIKLLRLLQIQKAPP